MRRGALVLASLLAAGCGNPEPPSGPGGAQVLRVGHFPNVTHVHGLVAHARTRAGKGWFEERLGAGVRVEWYAYNAGPGSMEALLAGSLDVTYVGPNPAVNAHSKSAGEEIRVLAGATRGGAALVVRAEGGPSKPEAFRGKRIATPQLGNTQDVACRAWLIDHGIRVTMAGGDASVLPTPNADQLSLFQRGEIDAAWTVEPWVARLEMEAGGRVFLEDKDPVTTVLAASARFLRERPDLARRFVAAHRELTKWIAEHAAEAKELVRAELLAETTRPMAPALLDRCWGRMRLDDAVTRADFDGPAAAAVKAGLLPAAPDLSRLVEILR